MKNLYGLPPEVIFCKKCVQSNQRPSSSPEHRKSNSDIPTVGFKDNICDACRYYDEIKRKIDWKLREQELIELCNKYRDPNAQYDVIVPGSGGKDSIYVAHLLKTKYNMKPLTVTWAPHIYTDVGRKNMDSWIKLGFDNILVTPNYKVHSTLTKLAFENLVNAFQPFIIGQKNTAPKIAMKYGIKLIMYGENSAEAHNKVEESLSPLMNKKHYTITDKNEKLFYGGVALDDLKKYNITKNDMKIYIPETIEDINKKAIEVHFMSYYQNWSPQENYYYVKKHADFLSNEDGRSEGTYTKFSSLDDKTDGQHYFSMFIKFGQGRTMNDTCRDIRDGFIDRDEAILLMEKYDGEFPKKYFKEFLEYINISEEKYWDIIDGARPSHLWEKKNGKWFLKQAIWKKN
jgi:N-acetyl sugar amidotransferase